MFYISGDVDTFVPTELTHQLYNKSVICKYKELWIIPGGNHNNTFQMAGPAYFVRVNQFFDKCLNLEFLAKQILADVPEDLTTKKQK